MPVNTAGNASVGLVDYCNMSKDSQEKFMPVNIVENEMK